ncbi:MAG: T9SS type A sorting domain-containing protein [Crocinitomicaceae bacterium]|nr:T9SS type A sorting domain-containing protein [Crocinitomicaceae bacterium]
MRNFILVTIIFVSNSLSAQDTMKFYDRVEYMDYIFGNLSDSLIDTGFLLDRNSELDSNWRRYELVANRLRTTQVYEDWFSLFQILSNSEMDSADMELPSAESILYPFYKSIYTQEPAVNGLRLPIAILDFKVNKFTNDALEEEYILFEDNQFSEGSNAELGIETSELFCAVPFADSIFFTDFWLVFDADYIHTNRNRTVDFIEVRLGEESFTLYENDEINLSPYLESENKIFLTIHYTDGITVINSSFNLDYAVPNRNLTDDFQSEIDFFDEVGSIGDDPMLRYGVMFGCGNFTTKFKKPAIFVAGYGASIPDQLFDYNLEGLQYLVHNSCVDYFHKFNIDHVLDSLLNTGHDVVIVRFIEPLESIMEGGDRLEILLNQINAEKFSNGSYIENIITGYSAGGLCVRYTLDKMEYKHLNQGAPNPHTKLYISFEGEQAGANVALGGQHALDFMFHFSLDPMNAFLHYIADCEQSRQLAKYFYTETGKYLEVDGDVQTSSYGQGAHQDRLDMFTAFEVTYATSKQTQKYGYTGYPAFPRIVCITNGSRTTQYTDFYGSTEYNQNSPYLFIPGHVILNHTFGPNSYFAKFISNHHLWGTESTAPGLAVFGYTHSNFWGQTQLMLRYNTDNYALILDNAPGGFIGGEPDPVSLVFTNFKKAAIDFSLDHFDYKPNCFTPLVFTLDIRNYDPVANKYQMHYDLQDEGLMFVGYDNFGIPLQSDFFGYPVLGHPNDHFAITPFEAIYADEYNATHISSLNVFGVDDDVDEDNLFTAGHPTTRAFMLNEMQYFNVYLQNYKVGWNTTTALEYKATYEATNMILIGKNVTPRTDVQPYEILQNGNITCYAPEGIHITDGFHVAEGGVFHAYIALPGYFIHQPCGNNHAPLAGGEDNDPEPSQQGHDETQIEQDQDFSIYPNPSTGEVNVIIPVSNGTYALYIFDLRGQLVYNSVSPESNSINLLLPAGVYIVSLTSQTGTKNKKLIVQ